MIPSPDVGIIGTKKGGKLPSDLTPRPEPKPVMPFVGPAPKLSKADKFAVDFFRTEKRLQTEDEHQEALIRQSGGVVPPTLQVVRNVNVVNMPNFTQVRSSGANSNINSGGPGAPPPSNDYPKRPPPPNGGGGGGPRHYGSQYPGFPRPNMDPKHDKNAPNVASINPLNGSINITDTTNIRDAGNRLTAERASQPAPIQPIPVAVPNPVNRLIPPVLTAPSQLAHTRPISQAVVEAVKIERGEGKRMRLTDKREKALQDGRLKVFTKINTQKKGAPFYHQGDLPHPLHEYDPPGMSPGVNPILDPAYSLQPFIDRAYTSPPKVVIPQAAKDVLPQAAKDARDLYGADLAGPSRPAAIVPKVEEIEQKPQVVKHVSAVPMVVSTTAQAGPSIVSQVNNALDRHTVDPRIKAEPLLPVSTKKEIKKVAGKRRLPLGEVAPVAGVKRVGQDLMHGRRKFFKTEDPANPAIAALKTVKQREIAQEREINKFYRAPRDRKGKGPAVGPGNPFEFIFPQMTNTTQQIEAALDAPVARAPRGDFLGVEIPARNVNKMKGKAKAPAKRKKAVTIVEPVAARTRSQTGPVASRTRSKKK
ncbi:hypothetical protein HDV00_009443 [Rhizophlyctis rosea]|nr:hypothetical protein HDV00_009443 [Rhizophlyctis rosea]